MQIIETSLVVSLLLLVTVLGNENLGRLVGSLTTRQHDVSGTLYVVDSARLRLVDFNYDGLGPDAYFWLGTDSSSPTANGTPLLDENGRSRPLRRYTRADVLLTLPVGIGANDIKWFSIWCRKYGVNFGSVAFPPTAAVTRRSAPINSGSSLSDESANDEDGTQTTTLIPPNAPAVPSKRLRSTSVVGVSENRVVFNVGVAGSLETDIENRTETILFRHSNTTKSESN